MYRAWAESPALQVAFSVRALRPALARQLFSWASQPALATGVVATWTAAGAGAAGKAASERAPKTGMASRRSRDLDKADNSKQNAPGFSHLAHLWFGSSLETR
jgi:hypothetical protein